ncbi:hypothetical protein AMTRI_Chr09g17590 [Amborella trichopoda]|uniref:Uncharacterized protein n=1 Tax=Amborella trichopoda TaxID=13333 RepID=W1PKH3_AMBTC|nr:protein NUCLEAR FUSION DEFECTIVE 4 [Amborella trichopoda]ERN08214.1 hypothetical protein AMTR_s00018p00201390 [Amborella trichopoda]|eukprot:XP_006846539.1 protein NUCLEAR FUSION DEFECTIVE 4 [Amborella trichopoda]
MAQCLAFVTNKWVGFVAAVWVQAISGNNYTFANYSVALKSLMGLTQLQLNNLSVAKDVGKAFGLVAGFASDRLPTSVILLIGSLEGLLGYGAQWLVVNQTIRPLSYWQMCIFMCMGGNSTTWMNTAVLVTCLRNFRRNRGPVSGILKGYVGLSTAIFTDIGSALFANNPAYFLLMLTFIPGAVCIPSMLFLREVPPASDTDEDRQEGRYFWAFNASAFAIAFYLLIFDLTGSHKGVVSRAFVVGLLLLLAAPVAVPVSAALRPFASRKLWDAEGHKASQESKVQEKEGERDGEGEGGKEVVKENGESEKEAGNVEGLKEEEGKRGKPLIGEEHTIWQAFGKLDFWVLFVSLLCGVGSGLAMMNNMGQIGEALGRADVSVFVSLMSIWGFFGRIASGTLSEYLLRRSATPRPLWNAASQILMAIGYFILAFALPESLYIGSIVVGTCYGVRIAVSVPIASELFGLKHYGIIYNTIILTLPLGSFLFSGLLAGILYDAQATRGAGGSNTCIGAHCYKAVFVIMAIVSLVGFGLDILLAFRTRDVYTKIHKMKKSAQTPTS